MKFFGASPFSSAVERQTFNLVAEGSIPSAGVFIFQKGRRIRVYG